MIFQTFFLDTGFLAFICTKCFLPDSVEIQGGLRSKCKAAESVKALLCDHERQALIVEEYYKLDDGKGCMFLCMRV